MIQLSPIDIIIIALYFCSVLYVGYRSIRPTSLKDDDFLLAGRSLTLPIFVMTLVSTWYGGVLGIGEFTYRYGISNWFVQGVPYYFFAGVFAFTLANKIRETNLYSIPDKLEITYGKRTALLGAVLTFILMTPAPYILMIGIFIQMLFGWNLGLSLIAGSVLTISYLYWGGFRSDIQTDILEFFIMFIGFSVIIPFCFIKFGGIDFFSSHLPPAHLTWHGGNSLQYIIVWFFIALWTLVDPAFHQRCYAAIDGRTAKKGILISIIFWFCFDLMTVTAGLYARAALPGLNDPITAFPMLAEAVLPPIAKGLFYIGLLATMMSTLNTLAFVSAQTLGRDIIWRWKTKVPVMARDGKLAGQYDQATGIRWTRIGLIISFILSFFIAFAIPSVIKIWYTIGTVVIPGLLIPVVTSYYQRLKIDSCYIFYSMLCGWLTSLLWLVTGILNSGRYQLNLEPMYPGLFVSAAIWFAGYIRKRVAVNTMHC